MRNPRLLGIVATLALATPLGAGVPTPAYAAGQTCDGKPTTIDVPQVSGRVDGTSGDDVIMVDPHPDGGDTGVPWSGHEPLGIFGDGGNDTICLTVAADVFGGAGDDTILSDAATQQAPGLFPELDGGAGSDDLVAGALASTMRGGTGDDTLSGGGGDDTLDGGGGADDRIIGGAGADAITIHAGTVEAGPGDDDVWTDGPARLELGPGRDVGEVDPSRVLSRGPQVLGGPGKDVIHLSGKYQIHGSTTRVDGGSGVNTLRADSVPARSKPPLWDVPAGRISSAGYGVLVTMQRFRRFVDLAHSDFVGGPGPQYFRGGLNSHAHGGGGNDVLVLDGRHSIAWGGAGQDECRAAVRHGCESG